METASRTARRIRSPPGVLVRAMRSRGGLAQHFAGRLVELEDVPLGVGDDHRLEDGLHHGIRKLMVHLLAAIFGIPQVANPHRHAIEFCGNRAQVIPGSPFDALLQFALPDAASGGRRTADGPDDGEEKTDGDQNPAQGADRSNGCGVPGERSALCTADAAETAW